MATDPTNAAAINAAKAAAAAQAAKTAAAYSTAKSSLDTSIASTNAGISALANLVGSTSATKAPTTAQLATLNTAQQQTQAAVQTAQQNFATYQTLAGQPAVTIPTPIYDTGATGPSGVSSAFETFKAQFAALGLSSLADSLISLSQSSNAPQTSDGYYLALLQTPEYKARFGDTNAMRIANGLPALTEAQILTNEKNYQDVMRQYGLPAGFYDQPSDYQKFIALDKSPAEVASIIQSYTDLARQQNPDVLAQLQNYYGLDVGHVAATLMDPAKAQPIINALTQNGTVAAAAGSAGIQDVTTAANMANTMSAGTLDYAKQAQAFAQAAQLSSQAVPLEQRYANMGVNYNFASGLQEALGGPEAVQAQLARQRLATEETSQFGGSAGADTRAQSLGVGTAQGVS